MAQRLAYTVLLTAAVLAAPVPSRGTDPPGEGAVTIRQVEWGFDGKVVARTFVPLSVLIENNGPAAVNGTLRLSKSAGRNRRDAQYEQSYYVSGFSSRWVQLTPYVMSDYENWTLEWGPELRNRQELPTPRNGDPATVLFAEADDVSAAGSALRRCDPALFPVSVTATDGLRAAVLHSVPNWQGARAQAFREWLLRGGRVYLLPGADGAFPRFPSELEFLNDPQERFRVGTGIVRRIAVPVAELDYATARIMILNDDDGPDAAAALPEFSQASLGPVYRAPLVVRFDELILAGLERLTRFHRNWWIVYGTAIVYLLVVFPGCFVLGRRAADWRWFYAGFLSTCALFSVGFARLGELGSAEYSRTRSVAVARQLEDGLYDVTQWTACAARDGGVYELRSPGSGRLYSPGRELEPVHGVVRLQDGAFGLDLPAASTASVAHRARVVGPRLNIRLEAVQADATGLKELALQFPPELYDRWMLACAWYRTDIYQLSVAPEGARLARGRQPAARFINQFEIVPWQTAPSRPEGIDGQYTTQQVFHTLLHQLAGTTLRLPSGAQPSDVALDPELLRVLLYRPMPAEFAFEGDAFPDQQGFVLYVVDYRVPVSGSSP